MSRSPTWAEVIRRAVTSQIEGLHLALPGQVERYDSAKQLVDVQPLIKASYEDEEGNKVIEQLPVIPNVPVSFPGAGGFRLTFPIAVGDTGILLFADASLDVWLEKGGLVDPGLDHRFALADAFFIPGIRDKARALTEAPTDRMTIGLDGGVQIHIDQSEIRLGSNTPAELQFVALAQKVADELAAIRSAFNGHTHNYTDNGAPSITAGPSSSIAAPGNVGSSNVKAKT